MVEEVASYAYVEEEVASYVHEVVVVGMVQRMVVALSDVLVPYEVEGMVLRETVEVFHRKIL